MFYTTTVLILMAKAKPVWDTFLGNCSAGGDRDVLFISSDGEPQVSNTVPHCKVELTEEDRRKLTNQGISSDCQGDDLSIISARISLDSTLELVSVLKGHPGRELSRSYTLEQVKAFLRSIKKPGGKSIYSNMYDTTINEVTISLQVLSTILEMEREILVTGASVMDLLLLVILWHSTIAFFVGEC